MREFRAAAKSLELTFTTLLGRDTARTAPAAEMQTCPVRNGRANAFAGNSSFHGKLERLTL